MNFDQSCSSVCQSFHGQARNAFYVIFKRSNPEIVRLTLLKFLRELPFQKQNVNTGPAIRALSCLEFVTSMAPVLYLINELISALGFSSLIYAKIQDSKCLHLRFSPQPQDSTIEFLLVRS